MQKIQQCEQFRQFSNELFTTFWKCSDETLKEGMKLVELEEDNFEHQET